jgi:hypothetical protein
MSAIERGGRNTSVLKVGAVARALGVLAGMLPTIQQRDFDADVLLSRILRAPKRIVPLALTGVQQ